MRLKSWPRIFVPLLLSFLLLISACGASKAPSRFSQTQQETTERGAPKAVASDAVQGSEFNAFFPQSGDGYTVVPAQEKKGFAEYKLKKDGQDMALLSISDTVSTPTAAAKFQQSAFTIAGYPAVEQGRTITALLVNDRFQVKVLSRDEAFGPPERMMWLERFNLQGLGQLTP